MVILSDDNIRLEQLKEPIKIIYNKVGAIPTCQNSAVGALDKKVYNSEFGTGHDEQFWGPARI